MFGIFKKKKKEKEPMELEDLDMDKELESIKETISGAQNIQENIFQSQEIYPEINQQTQTMQYPGQTLEQIRPSTPYPKKETIEEIKTMEENVIKPEIYVKLEKYKETLELLTDISDKIEELNSILEDLKSVKVEEDEKIKEWEKEIKDIKEKINKVYEGLHSD